MGGYVGDREAIVCSGTLYLSYSDLRWALESMGGTSAGSAYFAYNWLGAKRCGSQASFTNYEILVKSTPPQSSIFPSRKMK